MNDTEQIPARLVLSRANDINGALGHENLGFLSESHGFMPCSLPLPNLPRAFEAWDALATRLPELYRTLMLRSEVDAMEILDASKRNLPDSCLLRASALLSILAHAYYYVETKPPKALPECIRAPWEEVSRRLGRPQSGLSYIDLIVYNWRLLDPTRHDPMRLDNLRLLIPTVDNKEERIFYLTQTEILAQCTPIIGAVVRAQEAVSHGDSASLKLELLAIAETLQRVTRESLSNIDPKADSQTFMDPVVWAKTVAPFAVPFSPNLQGPSGTSSPIFNLLDVFFGRQRFDSLLGREIVQLRQLYPKHWQEFLVAVGQISVADYVRQVGDKELTEVLEESLERYAGERGFLGRHRLKVYGYLQLAFKVGRNVTIGGFSGVFKERTWNRVDGELESSRGERFPTAKAKPLVSRLKAGNEASRLYNVSDIVMHNNADVGYWLVLDGQVYDLTRYLNRHPGGTHILRSYAGVDATKAFLRIHSSQPAMASRLKSLHLGAVRPPAFDNQVDKNGMPIPLRTAYKLWVNVLYLIVEIENAFEQDLSLQQAQTIRDEEAGAWSPYKLQRAVETHERFVDNIIAGILGQAVTDLWVATRQLCSTTWATPDIVEILASVRSSVHARRLEQRLEAVQIAIARFADKSLSTTSPSARTLVGACELLATEDQRLIKEVKSLLRTGVSVFEENNDPHHLLVIAFCLPEALSAYYARLCKGLEVVTLSTEPPRIGDLNLRRVGDVA